ncbi:MAG: hypothetical protein QXR53_02420 [Candidatus Norongarragalinales archaeon]
MGIFSDWKGVVLKPFETFEDLKNRASYEESIPHFVVGLLPQLLGLFLSLILSFSVATLVSFVIGLAVLAISLAVGLFLTLAIARFLGGKGTTVQHVFAFAVDWAAYFVLAVVLLLVILILGALMVGSTLLSGGLQALDPAKILALVFGGGMVLLIIGGLLFLLLLILALRTYYYMMKSVHGFGVGKFILYNVVLVIIYFIVGFLLAFLGIWGATAF